MTGAFREDLGVYVLDAVTECRKTLRLPAYVLPTIGFPAAFYVLFALVLRNQPGGNAGTYMLATYGCFGVIGAALFAFGVGIAVERGQGWMLLRRAMPAPPGSWMAARMGVSLLFCMTIVVLMSLLALTVGRVKMPVTTWLHLGGVLVAGALPFSAFGLALGCRLGPNSAAAIVNLIYLPAACASGLWIPIEMLPPFMKSLALALPPYHFAQLALGVLGLGRGGPAWSHAVFLAGFGLLSAAAALAAYRHDEGVTFG
jgi:ABC-2 type transport system permease protein